MSEKGPCRKISVLLMFVTVAVLLLVVLSMGSESTQAKTIMVDDSGGEDFETIQDAVDNAEAGDTIRVYEGTYYETLWLNKTLTLIENSSRITTIDGEGKRPVLGPRSCENGVHEQRGEVLRFLHHLPGGRQG